MISLDDRKWKQFKIKDIFKIRGGKDYPKKNQSKGNLPFIGASSINNGIVNFLQVKPNTPKAIYRNAISVNRTGSVGYCFYHKYSAYYQGRVRALFKKNLDENIALFLCTCIFQQHTQFNYGFGLGTEHLKKMKINLPIDKTGHLDWEFMTNYMKQVRNEIPSEYVHNNTNHSKYSLDSKPWKQFKIKDLFNDVVSGRHYPKRLRHVGKLPFISSKAVNNGIRGFYTNKLSLNVHKNTISVSGVGESGCAFYHKGSFINDRDAHVLINPKFHINTYNALFICTCIYQQHTQFDYGFILKTNRLKNLKINLPVDSKNKPNWKFMTNYMKSMLQK